MIRKIMLAGMLAFIGLTLAACGDRVTINSGEVGKQLTTGGLEEDIRAPGSFRMDSCFITACPKLVTLQTAVSANELIIEKIFLPKSNVALDNVTFGIQYRIKPDKASIDQAFNDIKSSPVDGSHMRTITSDMIYDTYISRKAPESVIVALRNYTVEQALSEPDQIAAFVKDEVNKALQNTPVMVTEFGFPNGVGTPPQVVLTAKEQLYAVDEEKARDIKSLQADLEIEAQRQVVARERAKNDAEIASSIGIPVSVYQCLRTQDSLADAANKGTTVATSIDCGLGEPAAQRVVPLAAPGGQG